MLTTLSDRQESVEAQNHSPAAAQIKYIGNTKKSYLVTKRIFDVVSSILMGSVLLLPMALVALIIVIESPGPAIYKQERLGKDGKPYMMYKFRSMYMDAEKDGPQWAQNSDRRCTKVGCIIRRWHIDELPQLLNVIKGEMSVVGPRPEREYFYNEFEKEIPNFRARLAVEQGLTGISQVNGGYDLTPAQKLEYDIQYIQNQSLWLDIKCILKTFGMIFKHKGAR